MKSCFVALFIAPPGTGVQVLLYCHHTQYCQYVYIKYLNNPNPTVPELVGWSNSCVCCYRWANPLPQWSHSQEQHPRTLWEVPAARNRVHQDRMSEQHRGPLAPHSCHHRHPHHNDRPKRGPRGVAWSAASTLCLPGLWQLQCVRGKFPGMSSFCSIYWFFKTCNV